jgi:hypothetical protein
MRTKTRFPKETGLGSRFDVIVGMEKEMQMVK